MVERVDKFENGYCGVRGWRENVSYVLVQGWAMPLNKIEDLPYYRTGRSNYGPTSTCSADLPPISDCDRIIIIIIILLFI